MPAGRWTIRFTCIIFPGVHLDRGHCGGTERWDGQGLWNTSAISEALGRRDPVAPGMFGTWRLPDTNIYISIFLFLSVHS